MVIISPVSGSSGLGAAGFWKSVRPPAPGLTPETCERPDCGKSPPLKLRPSPRPRPKSGRWDPIPPRPGGNFAAGVFSPERDTGFTGNWMNPTLSPTWGPVGAGGGGGGVTGMAGGAGDSTAAAACSPLATAVSMVSASTASSGTGAATAGAVGTGVGSGGAVTNMIFSGSAAGLAGASDGTGFFPASCSSRYSAVILSRELEGTLAAVMPSSLAFARTSLFSRPSFFEIS